MQGSTTRSGAYHRWVGERTTRLQRLFEAHAAVQGSGPGLRLRTQQLNWALVLLLSAEFQGFARDLHDDSSLAFASLSASSQDLRTIILSRFRGDRQLDRGNAHPGSLGNDFGVLGVQMWRDLEKRWPAANVQWQADLSSINEARNAIAHSVSGRIQTLDLRVRTVRRWWSSLDRLTGRMDDVVRVRFMTLFNGTDPWDHIGGAI